MPKATHLIKVWFFASHPENVSMKEIREQTIKLMKHILGDALENIEVIDLSKNK